LEEKELAKKDEGLAVRLEDFIEVLTTDDAKLSIIGEELSNETGRSILMKLFDGTTSVSEISSSLNISIPLVRWHIQRLLKVNLITVTHIDLSEKNRKVKRYRPSKVALVIVPSSVAKSGIYQDILKSALKKTSKMFLGIATFIIGTTLIYQLQTNFGSIGTPTKTGQMTNGTSLIISQMTNGTIQIGKVQGANQLFFIDHGLALSLALGAIIGISTWVFLKLLSRKKIPSN